MGERYEKEGKSQIVAGGSFMRQVEHIYFYFEGSERLFNVSLLRKYVTWSDLNYVTVALRIIQNMV